MPRTQNSKNSSHYHYIVHTINDDGNTICSKYHKTQSEITNEYGLNRSAIYYILNPVENRVPRINRNFIIEKCMVPIYQTTYTSPQINTTPILEVEVN